MHWRTAVVTLVMTLSLAAQTVGVRPYELDWAGRTTDDHPPLVDFEDMTGWRGETKEAVASFERSREQQIWGKYVAKLVYRADGNGPEVNMVPPKPIPLPDSFDAVSCWIYGNNFLGRDKATPSVSINLLFADGDGVPFGVNLLNMRWQEWFLCHKRLTPEQIERVAKGGATFLGFRITGGRNKEDRVLYFDNLAVFKEEFATLAFKPRAKRGVEVFPGRDRALNVGRGRLPFPNRAETIVPKAVGESKQQARRGTVQFRLTSRFADGGGIDVQIPFGTCQWDGMRMRWQGRGDWIRPAVGGGIFVAGPDGKAVPPESVTLIDAKVEDGKAIASWSIKADGKDAVVQTTYWLLGQSLVADVNVTNGVVAQVRFGAVVGATNPRLVTLPYYTYGKSARPAVLASGSVGKPLFFAAHVDWTLSNASEPYAINRIDKDGVACNGGTQYTPKTNGVRAPCYERFVFCLSPKFEDVLPEIPNPESPWKHITGKGLWRAHGASNRENDAAHWRKVHRHGMTEIIVTDHETGWRDDHESFTFRTKTAPRKGGDKGQFDYARIMQDELGFTYGPYNNYTDFAPVNEFWSLDLINRRPDNQLQHAWARCYAPKPLRAVEYCEKLAPIIEKKFRFSTAYCDVHTAVTPWSRTDYDHRVPGAATFAATYYSYGEIMLLQKKAWGGPVYSEGNNHFPYCGLTDGNYAQDQRYGIPKNPWLVDFDLRRMHDLGCNFGMGNIGMFFGRKAHLGDTQREVDASIDRFLAATIAFGHPGFLVFTGGYRNTLRSYYMLQQLQERYTIASVESIHYVAEDGSLQDVSAAVASGAYRRNQIVTRYVGGVVTVVNGNAREPLRTRAQGRLVDLPPNAYMGWTDDGVVDVLSAEKDGHRADLAVTPKYLYVDGRGDFTRFATAASDGPGICRILLDDQYEVIPFQGSDCGFAISASKAVALAEDRKELGPAKLRRARGLTYVEPVDGAFSYLLSEPKVPAGTALTCDRDRVVPGESVLIQVGENTRPFRIPQTAKPGERIWKRTNGKWIDFTVVPLCRIEPSLADTVLSLEIHANVQQAMPATVTVRGVEKQVMLLPDKPVTVSVDLGVPKRETAEDCPILVVAGELMHRENRTLTAERRFRELGKLPDEWTSGMRLRGEEEKGIADGFGAGVYVTDRSCGGVSRNGLFMHPPYKKGEGYSCAIFGPLTVPDRPGVLRALVGKGDDSHLGDGILFRMTVTDAKGKETQIGEQTVTKHEWLPIEGDLAPWAGQQVQIRLISDVGAGDDSSGDWAIWANMRFEGKEKELIWELLKGAGQHYAAPPMPLPGVTVVMLRNAKQAWLRYDGQGLSGTGDRYGTFAIVNDVKLGNMAPAGGSERDNVWVEAVKVPLTLEAIRTLGLRNVFRLSNPGEDYFKVRSFWLEVELADGRKVSTQISTDIYSQPGTWLYAEGIGVPQGREITVNLWFRP
ncbi:MAG: hypothetical protein HN380_23260 [Victivallales bacterium]|nr:hypothetical protein [Victivallales bacterium]